MAMLTVYKKIFQHLLSSNLNEVYNFRLFASSNLPELICIQPIHIDLIKHSCFFGGEFLSILPYNNKNKNCQSSFHRIILWYHFQ